MSQNSVVQANSAGNGGLIDMLPRQSVSTYGLFRL